MKRNNDGTFSIGKANFCLRCLDSSYSALFLRGADNNHFMLLNNPFFWPGGRRSARTRGCSLCWNKKNRREGMSVLGVEEIEWKSSRLRISPHSKVCPV